MLTLLSLLHNLLNGVRVLTDGIASLSKTRTDSRGAILFGPAIIGALRRTQTVTHCIGATVLTPRRDGNPPREEYLDLHRSLDKANRDFFSAAMTKCIADVAVKLPVVVDGVIDNVIDKVLLGLFPPQVYVELKAKRGDNIIRVADAMVGAHADHATAVAASANAPPIVTQPPSSTSAQLLPSSAELVLVSPFPPSSPHTTTPVDLTPVETVISAMQQENIALLAKHAETSAADRRARIRAEKFTQIHEGLKEALAVPLLIDRPRKRSRDEPDGPSQDTIADRLHKERVDFARSQANAQLGIGSPQASDKTFSSLLRKVGEASKCLVNRYAKMAATDLRAAIKSEGEAAEAAAKEADDARISAAKGANKATGVAADAKMDETPNHDTASTNTDASAEDENDATHNTDSQTTAFSDTDTKSDILLTGASPTTILRLPAC